jgi:hypothetical protein
VYDIFFAAYCRWNLLVWMVCDIPVVNTSCGYTGYGWTWTLQVCSQAGSEYVDEVPLSRRHYTLWVHTPGQWPSRVGSVVVKGWSVGPAKPRATLVGTPKMDTENRGTTSLPVAKSRRARPVGQNCAPTPPRAELGGVKTLQCERRPSSNLIIKKNLL